jgi:flagellar motor switch protein FliG
VAELIDHRYDRPSAPRTSGLSEAKCSAWPRPAQRELEQLQDAPKHWLAEELSTELPQTAAVVLCHLHPQLAAKTLACLSTEKQIQVVKRIADYESISPEIVGDIVAALSSRLRLGRLAEINNTGGLALVAQIVQRLDHATERALLENLAQDNRPLVDQLLKLTFLLRDRQRVRSQSEVELGQADGLDDSRAA